MCMAWCEVDQKKHAWKLANNLAEMSEELIDLPRLLTEAMQSEKSQPILKDSASNTPANRG